MADRSNKTDILTDADASFRGPGQSRRCALLKCQSMSVSYPGDNGRRRSTSVMSRKIAGTVGFSFSLGPMVRSVLQSDGTGQIGFRTDCARALQVDWLKGPLPVAVTTLHLRLWRAAFSLFLRRSWRSPIERLARVPFFHFALSH